MSARQTLGGCLVLLAGVALVGMCVNATGRDSPPARVHTEPEAEAQSDEQAVALETCEAFQERMAGPVAVFESVGHLRFDVREVYVHSLAWGAMDAFEKEAFSRNMLRWSNCFYFPNSISESGTIFDLQSGVEIASVGILRGFRTK